MDRTICSFWKQSEADVAISLLRGHGLHPADLRTSPHVSHWGADQTFCVTIPEEEADEAIALLETQGIQINSEKDR